MIGFCYYLNYMNSYLITIIPPENVANTVNKYRNKYSKDASDKIPPHITIYPPFHLQQISEEKMLNLLNKTFCETPSFNLNFDSVDYFEGNNNVAYFAPDKKSSDYLKETFSKTITSLSGNVEDVPADYTLSADSFTPHMTIVSKIPVEEFDKIKNELVDIKENLSFVCKFIYLYKQDEKSEIWNSVGKIELKTPDF